MGLESSLDFFLGGIAVGAFLYAIGLMFYRKDDQLVSVKVGSMAGPIAMVAALSFLLAEMGHPLANLQDRYRI